MFKKFSYYLPNLAHSWLIVFLVIAGQFLAGLLGNLLISIGFLPASAVDSGLLMFVDYTLGFIPMIIFIAIISSRKKKAEDAVSIPVDSLDKGRLSHLQYWPLMIMTMVAFIFVVDAMPSPTPPQWFQDMMDKIADGKLIWTILSVGVAAPILEELTFRGIIMRGLLRKYTPMVAILWSAAFFGAVHLNPWQMIPAIVFGVFFGWVYYKTGSLWTTIMFHSINNTSSVLFAYFSPVAMNVDHFKDLFNNPLAYYILVALCFIIFAGGVYIIEKNIKYDKSNTSL